MNEGYDYVVVGIDSGSSHKIRTHKTPLTEKTNKALIEAFKIADGSNLKSYANVYVLQGDQKKLVDTIRGKRMTLEEILGVQTQIIEMPAFGINSSSQ